jgi:hypothetical protein
MNNTTTTFFTCCNGIYKNFIPVFVSSVLFHNDDAVVEIGTDSIPSDDMFSTTMKFLLEKYKNRILIQEMWVSKFMYGSKMYNISPNSVRFMVEPKLKSKYVYISDIDIIVLEKNISAAHIKNMKDNNTNYSNVVRPSKEGDLWKRMTGCHFAEWDYQYPIPDYKSFANLRIVEHDECYLYNIISRKCHPNESLKFRPIHGIHVSPNRPIVKTDNKPGWSANGWKEKWTNYRYTEEFKVIEKNSSDFMKDIFLKLDNYYKTTDE